MNYYERHLGDYAKDTAHLSMLEHGAYGLLLDRYYGTESGIPEAQAHRVARARSKEEKQAVDDVLAEFFELIDGVWVNHRTEREIAKAQAKISAAKENGKKGGRPVKSKSGSETETQEKPSGLSVVSCEIVDKRLSEINFQNENGLCDAAINLSTQPKEHGENQLNQQNNKPSGLLVGSETETQEKALQAPSTRHHIKPKSIAASLDQPVARERTENAAALADPIVGRAIEITALLAKRGAAIQASNPTVRAWAEQGVTDTQALQALDIANERRQERADPSPVNAGLLNAIIGDIRNKPLARASPQRISHSDASKLAAARAIFGTEIEGDQHGQSIGRVIDITPTAARIVGC